MVIAKSPVLINSTDRRQVVIYYNEKSGEFRITTNSLYRNGDSLYEESGNGLYIKDERRAQYLFLENWETLHSCGYMIDQDNYAEKE